MSVLAPDSADIVGLLLSEDEVPIPKFDNIHVLTCTMKKKLRISKCHSQVLCNRGLTYLIKLLTVKLQRYKSVLAFFPFSVS